MIAAVVLAAGTSSRLGRPKQVLPLHGRPVLQHVIDAALAAGIGEVVVVLGHAAEEVKTEVEFRPPVRAVLNREYEAGQSSSLRAGLRALDPRARAAVVLLGDQPGITGDAIRSVVAAYERTGGPVVQACYHGHRGHPVFFARRVWPELEALQGDRGARDLLAQHPDWVVAVEIDRDPPADLDTWDDYERLAAQPGF